MLSYVEPPYDDEDTEWHIYTVTLDPHALADILGLEYETRQLPLRPTEELKSLASFTGEDWKEIAEAVWSNNPMTLAFLTEMIASYGGWENWLNADAEHLSYDEFVRQFGEKPSNRPEEEERPHKHAHGRRKYR